MSADLMIEEKIFELPAASFHGVDVLAAADRGCSLTKILFGTAGSSPDTVKLHMSLFHNRDFEAAIDFLAQQQLYRRDGKLHVTGVGCDKYRDVIERKLGLQIQFVDEFSTMITGVHWLVKHLSLQDLCYADEVVEAGKYEQIQHNPDSANLMQQWQVEASSGDEDQKFPFLFGLIGSGGGFLQVQESGQCQLVGGVQLAGKAFLGFGKMLLGTADYDEILELACKGDRRKVDNVFGDLIRVDDSSPYGSMPASLPIFPFGKVVDDQMQKDNCKREDLAHALVAAFAVNIFNIMSSSAKCSATPRVIFGGNFFRHSLMRREFMKQKLHFNMHSIKIHFLLTGHSGAVGAMVSDRSDGIANAVGF